MNKKQKQTIKKMDEEIKQWNYIINVAVKGEDVTRFRKELALKLAEYRGYIKGCDDGM